jgi:hypothetical protein
MNGVAVIPCTAIEIRIVNDVIAQSVCIEPDVKSPLLYA